MNIRIFSRGMILVLWMGTGLFLEGQDSTKYGTDRPFSLQPGVPRLFEGMGPYRREFSTRSPQAQKFLNQGMVWIQGFNHDEARRSFLKATELDSGCAWAWWGVAYCEGPNYNDPAPDQNRSRAGWYAIQNALARLKGASELEKDLVLALQQRFSHPVARPRAQLDRSYADAMAKVWKKYPEDADVGALYAEARMQLRPWALYRKSRQPQEGTLEIRDVLEKVMQLDPNHAGARHLYIHAVEPSREPEKALAAARVLNDLVPACGHLLHMPSHIYIQTGNWQEAIDQNLKAVASDRLYRNLSPDQMIQYVYQAHNAHMLSFSAMMVGQEKIALQYAREAWNLIPKAEREAKSPAIDFTLMCLYDVQKRFGRWDAILAEPQPPAYLPLTTAYYHAHRAVAHAAKKDFFSAEKEYALFVAAKMEFPEDTPETGVMNHRVLEVAQHFVRGEIALQKKNWETAIWHLKEAALVEDQLRYTEPPYWLQPVRHALGAVYMKAGRYSAAEKNYREDLKIWRENGWSLSGLAQSLAKQGKKKEAAAVTLRLEKCWENADHPLPTTSCKCIESLAAEKP